MVSKTRSVAARVKKPANGGIWDASDADDQIAEEVPVAMVYNGVSHVVMMATPDNLEEFAIGFTLTEGIATASSDIYGVDVAAASSGYQVLVELSSERFAALKQRRRNLTGRTGCGLCGAESLQQAIRVPPQVVSVPAPSAEVIDVALSQLVDFQPLQRMTGAVHGAAWCSFDGNIQMAFEDVGRHNALDKLIGALHRQPDFDRKGFVLVSSRASYELVGKCAAVGIGTLVAVSAPTTMAIEHAELAGMNLIGFARSGRHVVYVS